MKEFLKDVSDNTPDPDRALRNLSSFIDENPEHVERLRADIRAAALIFSHSQFLSNYSASNPEELFNAIEDVEQGLGREAVYSSLKLEFEKIGQKPSRASLPLYMNAVRRFRLREFLKITLRDLMKKADLIGIMSEMSMLADVIISASLEVVRDMLRDIYGRPEDEQFGIISLGKLGAEELNYSSDVDFIYVYNTELGETSGVLTEQGIRKSRISNHEYYCKVGEELSKFLAQNTESGFAYRVDLRLRPEGQKGALALALRGYEMYYESWGRAWERAMLLRARPVAGEEALCRQFMDMIRPFVFRKYLDYSSIDEISKLKTRIDATFKKNDIKRGFGGIREIEFFGQALQLMYAGREPLLRERSTLKTLHRLSQKGLIGMEDYGVLSDNYIYLRTLEHRLQQVSDLQTHTVPSGDIELDSLARKMGYVSKREFSDDLQKRRNLVHAIYESLFSSRTEESSAGSTFFDEEFSDAELKEYLSRSGVRDADKALRNIKSIKDSIFNFQTLRGRRLLSDILPMFLESSLKAANPDIALNQLQSFALFLSTNESYLEVFTKNRILIDLIVYVFSESNYLSKMLMSRPQYLETIGWQETARRSLEYLRAEIRETLADGKPLADAIRFVKQTEEIRTGLSFLQKRMDVIRATKALSRTAEAILSTVFEMHEGENSGLAIIGFGKLGGREIAFGSDLDLIFVSAGDVTFGQTKAAEGLLRLLVSYTRDGVAYNVDTRLRPEGSKGPLVSSVDAFSKYYSGSAAFWEFQALLKARPVAGDVKTGMLFMQTAHEALLKYGPSISALDVRQMRERIKRDLAKENSGYDIKLGPGGIEEIEFLVQYLQLRNCANHPELLVQSTLIAIRRLSNAGVIKRAEAETLSGSYVFLRTIDVLLRLKGETVLKKDESNIKSSSEFSGYSDPSEFAVSLDQTRKAAEEMFMQYLFSDS